MTTELDHRPDTESTDVVVVGGGLAGLAAAAAAARAGRRVVVLEGRDLGGRARIDQRGGYRFNRGPRALYLRGPGQRTLHELGVPVVGSPPPTRGGRCRRSGELHLLPQGPGSLLRTRVMPAGEKAAFGRRLALLPRLDPAGFTGLSADAAVASLGMGPIGTELALALVRLATYTAATDVLDGPAAIAQLQRAAGEGVIYVDGGWQTLVEGLALRAREAGADIRTSVGAGSIDDGGGGVTVTTTAGTTISAPAVVLAVGGPGAVEDLLGRSSGVVEDLGPPAAAACLELGLTTPPPTRLVIGVDEPLYLSTHCPPADLAPDGGAVVHVMRYLRHDESRPSQQTRAELRELARQAGVVDGDVVEERFLAHMVVTGAIPTAARGLDGRQPVRVEGRPAVLLAGDWVGPEGLLGDAALASGATAGRIAADRAATLTVA